MIVLIDALPRPLDTLHWRLSSYSNIYDYAGNIRQILLSGCKNLESLSVLILSLEAHEVELEGYASDIFELCKSRKIVVKSAPDFDDYCL